MKTITFKFITLLALLLSFNGLHAQYVDIQGKIKDASGKKIRAHYVVMCDDQKMYAKKGAKLHLKFKPNHSYRVTFIKPGYATKTISFTTYSRNHDKFAFNFDITLKELSTDKLVEEGVKTNVADVYYDPKRNTYAYKCY